MTTSSAPSRFRPLEQADFQALEHAPYLKGLLKPFKGKGALEDWARQCEALRDGLIALAQRRVLQQLTGAPFSRLSVRLAQQTTGAGTTFLRWRNPDRSSMGVRLWVAMMEDPRLPTHLRADLHALECERAVLNMQISLLHTLARQADDCARKLDDADAVTHRTTPTPDRGDAL